ncbi:DUF262 domain-containing protein [Candidatus Desantisbacteria bacterium]|nr:DUF262 domain-containing protein [Candidatus Desantisbacteria bacterium]
MYDEKENGKEDIQEEPVQSEIDDSESTPVEFEITTYPADYTLQVYYEKWKSDEIIIPTFQRKFVWKPSQASRLIESFMLGLPIPQIFIYTDKEQKLLIIDGQQRLKSIFYFFEGLFGEADKSGKRKVFNLDSINEKSKWFNKTFNDFTDADKRKLNNSVLRAIIIKQLDPNDDTSVYHIFERLNTGGTLLKNQEVRNCVYSGKLNGLLLKLNTYPAWRKILGKPKEDSSQKDVELILRYISLFHQKEKEKENYKKPMKDFLSSFMKKNRNPSDKFIEDEENRFKKTCDLIIAQLGEKPFNPRGTLNVSFFDSVFVAFAKHFDKYPDDIKARYDNLKSNADFNKYTTSSTTDVEVVKNRLKIAAATLFGEKDETAKN